MKENPLAAHEEVFRAAIDRLIPKDEFPGGWESGSGEYILGLLASDCADLVPLYRDGLAALDAEAQAVYNAGFAELAADKQDDILRRVEAGDVAAKWPVSPRQFFDRLVCQSMEGYYGDPGNGGNRGEASWQMVGFRVTA